jgi:hypothetical protein
MLVLSYPSNPSDKTNRRIYWKACIGSGRDDGDSRADCSSSRDYDASSRLAVDQTGRHFYKKHHEFSRQPIRRGGSSLVALSLLLARA